MAKTIYYSKKYQAQQLQQEKAETPSPATVATSHQSRKVGPMLLALGLLLGILSVLVVPLMADSAAPVQSGAPTRTAAPPVALATAAAQTVDVYATPQEALAAAGIGAVLPAQLPEGFSLSECRVLDGEMVELAYTVGKSTVVLRSAAGTADLSDANYDAFSFTIAEEVNGVTRGYTGVSDKKLYLAVWVNGDHTYAVVAEDGLEATVMREFAEAIA